MSKHENENLNKAYRRRKAKPADKSRYYVTNEQLISEIKKVYETGVITKTMGDYIMKIVEGISYSPNFMNYSYLDCMKSDAIFRICKAISDKKIDIIPEEDFGKPKLDKDGNQVYTRGDMVIDENGEVVLDEDGNPIYHQIPVKITQNNVFGYFSIIAWRAFQNKIKVEANQTKIVEAFREKVYEELDLGSFDDVPELGDTTKSNDPEEGVTKRKRGRPRKIKDD